LKNTLLSFRSNLQTGRPYRAARLFVANLNEVKRLGRT
jgi:hypothetical protein